MGHMSESQSNELTSRPPVLVHGTFVYRGVHMSARALHVLNLIWFGSLAVSLACPDGEEGNFFVQMMISTCLATR
jgi:hypothetical protein